MGAVLSDERELICGAYDAGLKKLHHNRKLQLGFR
jgi:hypothetical protein